MGREQFQMNQLYGVSNFRHFSAIFIELFVDFIQLFFDFIHLFKFISIGENKYLSSSNFKHKLMIFDYLKIIKHSCLPRKKIKI